MIISQYVVPKKAKRRSSWSTPSPERLPYQGTRGNSSGGYPRGGYARSRKAREVLVETMFLRSQYEVLADRVSPTTGVVLTPPPQIRTVT